MNIVVADTGETVNRELISNLGSFAGVPTIIEGIASSIGCRPDQLSDSASYPVIGYVFQPETVFSAYLATPFKLSIFELDRVGSSLLVSLPWSRVSRIVQTVSNGTLSVSIEIDADRTDLLGTLTKDSSGAELITGSIRRSGYTISAQSDDTVSISLNRFASLLRRNIR